MRVSETSSLVSAPPNTPIGSVASEADARKQDAPIRPLREDARAVSSVVAVLVTPAVRAVLI